MSASVLHLERVSHRFGEGETEVMAVDDVSLDVAAGELVAVTGTSGSGKSTLLAIAGGLLAPSSGEVLVEGRSLVGISAKELAMVRRTQIGFVFQDFNLLPTLTAAENVAIPLELSGHSPRSARREACGLLEQVGLGGKADAFPDELSGGQQQRVAIARSVIGGRRLLLADEPTGALDARTGEQVLRLLRARVDAGVAGVIVTHDSRHAAWADRVVFVRDGRIVDARRAARPEDLLEGAEQ